MQQLAALGTPSHFLIQQLSTAATQLSDDSIALIEVVPEPPGVEQLEFVFLVAGQFPQPCIVEQQSAIFVDHAQTGRTELQGLAELALMLGCLDSKSDAIGRRRRLACYRVGRHAVSPEPRRKLASNPGNVRSGPKAYIRSDYGRSSRGCARQNHPDFGEFAGLRIDFN